MGLIDFIGHSICFYFLGYGLLGIFAAMNGHLKKTILLNMRCISSKFSLCFRFDKLRWLHLCCWRLGRSQSTLLRGTLLHNHQYLDLHHTHENGSHKPSSYLPCRICVCHRFVCLQHLCHHHLVYGTVDFKKFRNFRSFVFKSYHNFVCADEPY